jgi:hypothetical protein
MQPAAVRDDRRRDDAPVSGRRHGQPRPSVEVPKGRVGPADSEGSIRSGGLSGDVHTVDLYSVQEFDRLRDPHHELEGRSVRRLRVTRANRSCPTRTLASQGCTAGGQEGLRRVEEVRVGRLAPVRDGRRAGGGDRGRPGRQAEVGEDLLDDGRRGDEGEDAAPAAAGTGQDVARMCRVLNGLWCRRTFRWRTSARMWGASRRVETDRVRLREEVADRATRLVADGVATDLATRLAIEKALVDRGYLRVTPGRLVLRA